MNYRTLHLKPGDNVPNQLNFDFNGYEDLEALVGGGVEFSEMVIEGQSYDILFDEEGKLKNKQPALVLAHDGVITDSLCGDIYFLKADADGKTLSLNQKDIDRILNFFESSSLAAFVGEFRLPVYDWFQC